MFLVSTGDVDIFDSSILVKSVKDKLRSLSIRLRYEDSIDRPYKSLCAALKNWLILQCLKDALTKIGKEVCLIGGQILQKTWPGISQGNGPWLIEPLNCDMKALR